MSHLTSLPPVTVHVFEEVPDISDAKRAVYLRTRKSDCNYQLLEDNIFGLSLWGLPTPFMCQLQPTSQKVEGVMLNCYQPECRLPVAENYLPQWVALFNSISHGTILLPLFAGVSPPTPFVRERVIFPKEYVDEARQEILRGHHLVYYDYTPRKQPLPPRQTNATGLLVSATFKAA